MLAACGRRSTRSIVAALPPRTVCHLQHLQPAVLPLPQLLGCATLFWLAMVLKTVIARAVSSHFQKEAHFAKMKEALEKVLSMCCIMHACMCMCMFMNTSSIHVHVWAREQSRAACCLVAVCQLALLAYA